MTQYTFLVGSPTDSQRGVHAVLDDPIHESIRTSLKACLQLIDERWACNQMDWIC